MAQGEGFKHITVSAGEDDEIVYAGAVRHDSAAMEGPGDWQAAGGAPDTVVPGGAREAGASPSVSAESEEADRGFDVRSGDATRREAPAKRAQAAPRAKRDDYRETTLEDLQSAPMPLAQKIVIIAAVLCIIGAIVYGVAFLG